MHQFSGVANLSLCEVEAVFWSKCTGVAWPYDDASVALLVGKPKLPPVAGKSQGTKLSARFAQYLAGLYSPLHKVCFHLSSCCALEADLPHPATYQQIAFAL